MVQSGNKGFDLKSNFNKMLLFTMLRMINHLRPRNRRSSQHDLPNLDWQLFAAPLSTATLDDPKVLIKLLTPADDDKVTTTREANTRQYRDQSRGYITKTDVEFTEVIIYAFGIQD